MEEPEERIGDAGGMEVAGDVQDRDDDGSSSSDSDTELQQQITDLEATLADSPYHYDSHVQLIQLLRQQGDLDGARKARHAMTELFPLTEELWLEWLGDELTLASLPEACMELRQLFEKAVGDYLSVTIWLEYAKFAVDKMSVMPEGMEFPRAIFEKGIIACGLHVGQAGVLWDAYREYETAVLTSMQQLQQTDPADDGLKAQVEAQYERVDKLYRRQLAVPLIGMESTFQEYQGFSEKAVTEESLPAYARAKSKLEDWMPYENELQSSTPPSFPSYRSYLSHVRSSRADPTLVNTLYQRALAHHCLDTGLWKEYLTFLTQNFSRVISVLLPGYRQAVRNCPWVAEFWVGSARAQERMGVEHEDIVATFEKGLIGNFSDAKDSLQLWTAYCDYLRRRVDAGGEGKEEEEGGEGGREAELTELRKTFKRARDNLDASYGQDGDPTDTLSRYQAGLEARCYGNMEEARHLWDDVMPRHAKEARYWLEYTDLERCYGDHALCRKLLQRAVNTASDDPERVCQALLGFEREVGSLETFEAALERCAAQMNRVKERREKAAEKEAQQKGEKKQRKKAEKTERKTAAKAGQSDQRGEQQQQQKPNRRKRPQATHFFFDDDNEGPKAAAPKRVKVSHDRDDARPVTTETKSAPQATAAEVRQPSTGVKLPPGRKMSQDNSKLTESPSSERKAGGLLRADDKSHGVESEGKMEVGGSEGVAVVGSKESRTVFVSNLIFSVTEEQLKEKFSECGGTISDVRLIKTRARSGKGNVYAYVEFTSPGPVQEALKLDRGLLNERPIFVSQFREKGSQPAQPRFARSNRKATVYVTNIHHHATEQELGDLFKQCGEIKEVRLVRNRAGRSKGFAYIEYENEPSANTAVLKLDEYQLGLKKIKVAISNPPKKADQPTEAGPMRMELGNTDPVQLAVQFVKPSFMPTRVQQRQDPTNPLARKSKTHVSLVPRVLARKEAGQEGEGPERGEGKKLSNEDFRKLLMKK